MPSQIFPVEYRVIDSHVLALPKRVLGYDMSIPQFHVLTILKNVFRIALQAVNLYVIAEHKGIGTFVKCEIVSFNILTTPECLVCIVNDNILQLDIMHLTKHLWSVNLSIAHLQMVAIPQCRTGTCVKLTTAYLEAMYMPERILSPEMAVLGLYV